MLYLSLSRYRPTLPVSYVSRILGFTCLKECTKFLESVDAVLLEDGMTIECKLTLSKLNMLIN